MKRKRDEKTENRSFKTTTMQGLTVIKESVKWEEETCLAHYNTHGPIFDRFFSIDEITAGKTFFGLKFHGKFQFCKISGENVAKFEVKFIEGAENIVKASIELHYSYDDVRLAICMPSIEKNPVYLDHKFCKELLIGNWVAHHKKIEFTMKFFLQVKKNCI